MNKELSKYTYELARELIRREERLILNPYDDGSGNTTVGYGHAIYKAGSTFVYQGKTIDLRKGLASKQMAEALLTADMSAIAKHFLNYPIHLTPFQAAALIAFVFNIGLPAFLKSQTRRALDKGDIAQFLALHKNWIYAFNKKLGRKVVVPALVRRRSKERALFVYTTKATLNLSDISQILDTTNVEQEVLVA